MPSETAPGPGPKTKTLIVWGAMILSWAILIAILFAVLLIFGGCAGRGVVEPTATTDAGGTTLRNPPPNTVTVTEPDMGTWAATGASAVKATRASADGVSHLGTGVGRQLFIQTGSLEAGGSVIAIGSESDITGRGIRVMDPAGERVVFEAKEFTTGTSAPVRAHAEALSALEGIVRAVVEGQRDVALAQIDAQRSVLEAAVPGITDRLLRLIAP